MAFRLLNFLEICSQWRSVSLRSEFPLRAFSLTNPASSKVLDCLLEGNKCEGRGELMHCAINWFSDFWSPFLLPCPGKGQAGTEVQVGH